MGRLLAGGLGVTRMTTFSSLPSIGDCGGILVDLGKGIGDSSLGLLSGFPFLVSLDRVSSRMLCLEPSSEKLVGDGE